MFHPDIRLELGRIEHKARLAEAAQDRAAADAGGRRGWLFFWRQAQPQAAMPVEPIRSEPGAVEPGRSVFEEPERSTPAAGGVGRLATRPGTQQPGMGEAETESAVPPAVGDLVSVGETKPPRS